MSKKIIVRSKANDSIIGLACRNCMFTVVQNGNGFMIFRENEIPHGWHQDFNEHQCCEHKGKGKGK